MPKNHMTTAELSEILGIATSTIRSRFAEGEDLHPVETVAGNIHLWAVADVRRFLRNLAKADYTMGRPTKIDPAAAQKRLQKWLEAQES